MNTDKNLQIVTIEWSRRWQVYHRLKALEIECYCRMNEPLKVIPNSPQQLIQLWSIVKEVTNTKQELVEWLNQCWQIKSDR
ncbi:MAG: Asr1405/Asl0597 family protein [Xenococcus sp. (in: cyanobacteria)]